MADRHFTAYELAECARREVSKRRYTYPREVSADRMTPERAAREIAMMEEIERQFRAKSDADPKADGRLF